MGTPFWKFWNPQSGLVGGIIAGAVFVGLVEALLRILIVGV